MNEVLNFFQEVIASGLDNQKPVGLSGFRHPVKSKISVKKHIKKEDVKISDLLRRH